MPAERAEYMKIKPKITLKNALISLSVVVLTVLADFITKRVVMNSMQVGESIPLIKDVLHITYITNDGAAFGSFSEHRWVFMSVSALLIVFLTCTVIFWDNASALFYVSLPMIIGGGIGNMIDRIAYKTVVDFIDFRAFPSLWKWIFNGADSFITVGVILMILWFILEEVRNSKQKQHKQSDGSENTDSD